MSAPAGLATIGRFNNLPEAYIVKGRLEAAGIPCFVAGEVTGNIPEITGAFLGDMELQVPTDRLEEARRLLAEEPPQEPPSLEP